MGETAGRFEVDHQLLEATPLRGSGEESAPEPVEVDQGERHRPAAADGVPVFEEDDGGEPLDESEEAEPFYDTLEEWVNQYFLAVFIRHEGGEFRWCREWWRHPEAIVRLDSLWRSWESLRLDEQMGMSTWLRDHLDHHLPVLMGQAGPFRKCSSKHLESHPLEAEFAPDGWWDEQE